MDNIDYEGLREDLINYFGTAMITGIPMATADLIEVEQANNDQLIKIAKRNGIDLQKYINDWER